jgi:hypothetical protein
LFTNNYTVRRKDKSNYYLETAITKICCRELIEELSFPQVQICNQCDKYHSFKNGFGGVSSKKIQQEPKLEVSIKLSPVNSKNPGFRCDNDDNCCGDASQAEC